MASIPLDIPQQNAQSEADFSKQSSPMESLGASFVLGFENSSFGKIKEFAKREYELSDDNSDIMQPDELNEKYPYMGTPFASPVSARKAEMLAKKAQKDMQLQRIANGHRDSTLMEIGKFGAGLAGNIIDPIGVAAGIGVGAGLSKVLAKTMIGNRITAAAGTLKHQAQVTKSAQAARNVELSTNTIRNMAEGAAGNLLEEALIAAPLSKEEQQDYDAYEAVAFAIGAGMALPAVTGAFRKGFDFLKRKPELTEKATILAEQQFEQGKRVDVSEIEKQAMREALPDLEAELQELSITNADPDRVRELQTEIENIKSIKPMDNKTVVENANSYKSEALYRPEFERLNDMDEIKVMDDSEAFEANFESTLEETRQAFNLDESDPLLVTAKQELEGVKRSNEAIKQLIACERRAS